MRFQTASVIVLALALALGCVHPVSAQERFGGLTGTVTDTSNAPVPGATVTVTNKQTGAARTVVTGGDGAYLIPNLEPGRYGVAIELSGFQKFSTDDVLVLLGRTYNVNAQLKVGAISETVNVTADAEKQIDLKSVTLSHNVTSEELDRIPKTRSFQGVAVTSPGVNQGDIEGGIQVNGASGAENAYTVDGVVTNSLIYGSSRQDTVFEYLQEVQVKTGGIEAEYGGALGGVISAVTKSGGNIFTGEAHYYYIGNGLSAAPVQRLVLNPLDNNSVGFFKESKQKNNRSEPGASAGGPLVKDRLFFFGSFSPRIVRQSNDYLFSNGTDPGSIPRDQTFWQGFGKLTYTNGGRVQANATLLMTPTRSTGQLIRYDGFGSNSSTNPKAATTSNANIGYAQNQDTLSGNVDIWIGRSSYVTVRGGYFYDTYKDTGIPLTTSYTYQTPSFGIPGVPANLQGGIGTNNTPRLQVNQFDTTKQGFAQVDYNNSFEARGTHLLKGGFGFRRSINNVNNSYPGGWVYLYWGQSFTSTVTGKTDTGTYGYYEVDDRGTKGQVGANIYSLYVQDAWTINRLTLNLGVRTENEKLPTFRPDIRQYAFQFGFGDKIAPRLGASYDVHGDGRMKVYGSWGRYFDWTKYELSRGSFGGDVWHIFYHSLDTLDIGSLNLSNLPGRDLWGSSTGFRDRRATYINNTDPNIKPMYQDGINAGLEYQWNPRTVVGLRYVHNDLRRTIEDMGSLINGDNVYVIGNPGEGQNTVYPPSYPEVTAPFPMPKPKRQYDAVELTFDRRFSKNWFVSGNYTWSRLYGNYTGLSDTDEIAGPTDSNGWTTAQVQSGTNPSIARPGSNAHTAWDVDEILWDAHGHLNPLGRLPTDRPHVVKMYGAYTFNFGTQVGLNFYGGSGTPISTYVIVNDGYQPLVNGRGDMGRTPVLTRTDLLVAHELKLRNTQKVRFELNVINLFNQQTATHIFNFLNKGAPGGGSVQTAYAIDLSQVNLAQGYDYNALILKTSQGAFSYNPRYGKADLFQPALQGQFSVRYIF